MGAAQASRQVSAKALGGLCSHQSVPKEVGARLIECRLSRISSTRWIGESAGGAAAGASEKDAAHANVAGKPVPSANKKTKNKNKKP